MEIVFQNLQPCFVEPCQSKPSSTTITIRVYEIQDSTVLVSPLSPAGLHVEFSFPGISLSVSSVVSERDSGTLSSSCK